MAYSACVFELGKALKNNGLTLSDVGLADYRVPEVE